MVGLGAGLADLLVELVALLDPGGVLGVHCVDGGGLFGDLRGEDGDLRGDFGLLGVELAHAAGQDDTQAGAQVVAQQAVTLRLGGLALERVHLARDLVEDVVDAGEVDLGGLQAQLGEALLGLEAGDSGGLFEDGAAVHGLGAEDLADALLADDGVGLAAQAGSQEDVLNVAQAADLAVEQVLGVAGAEEAAGDGDLTGADRGAAKAAAADLEDDPGGGVFYGLGGRGLVLGLALVDQVAVQLAGVHDASVDADDDSGLRRADGLFGLLGLLPAEPGLVPVAGDVEAAFAGAVARPVAALLAGQGCAVVELGIDQGERDLGHSGGLAVACAGEDDVLHADAAQALGGLLAQHPHDGVGDVRLAAAVGADHGGDAVSREMDLRAVAERLEAEHLDLFELEQTTPPGTAARPSQRREADLQIRAVRNRIGCTAQLPI